MKRQALDNIARAGMKTNLQVTVINGVNGHVTGDIVRFAVDNIDKIRSVLFQPIMFAGRDAGVADDERRARRYTFADLAADLGRQRQAFEWEPMRDWFPMSIYTAFGKLFDRLRPHAEVGSLYADAHPSQAIVSPLLVSQITKAVVPISAFLDVEGLLQDVAAVADEGKGVDETKASLARAVLRRFDPRRAPAGFTAVDLFALLERFLPRFRSSDAPDWSSRDNSDPKWRLLMIAGMWFQDLFNLDFEVIGMDAVATATQEGEISFCAYSSAGWRSVIEHVHKTAPLAVWHNAHGRHPIYAMGRQCRSATMATTRPPVAGIVPSSLRCRGRRRPASRGSQVKRGTPLNSGICARAVAFGVLLAALSGTGCQRNPEPEVQRVVIDTTKSSPRTCALVARRSSLARRS